MKPAIRLFITFLSSVLVSALVLNLVDRVSAKKFPIQPQTLEILGADGVRPTPYAPVESPPVGPVVPQEELMDAATRTWFKSLSGTRRGVALALIETVSESGARIVSVGSWVTGVKHNDPLTGGTSDQDMRLTMSGANEAEAVGRWRATAARREGPANLFADIVGGAHGADS